MATVFGAIQFRRVLPSVLKSVKVVKSGTNIVPRRHCHCHFLTTPTGAIPLQPKKAQFPLLKIICVLTAGIYVGAAIAKNGANILEENEIFVPSDDDEED